MANLTEARIQELCDSYKIIVSLSMLAIAEDDIDGIFTLNESLKRIWELVKNSGHKDLELLETYQKILALEYSKLETESINDKLKLIKLAIDFDYSQSLHCLELAKFLHKEKKYPEAIILAQYLATICNEVPPLQILGKCYRELKMYDMSIKAYNSYLLINKNDKKAKEELNEIYEEMLDLR